MFVRLQEKLKFPSGTATAKVMRMLHGGEPLTDAHEQNTSYGPLLPVVEEVTPLSMCSVQISRTAKIS